MRILLVADGEEASCEALEFRPDILILDIGVLQMNGAKVLVEIRRVLPQASILILADSDSIKEAETLLRMVAQRPLPGSVFHHRIVSTLQLTEMGNSFDRHPSIDAQTLGTGCPPGDEPTQRELDVLRLVAEGHRNRDIARRLYIAERTVSFHLSNLLSKLRARSRTELVHLARQKGWIS